MDSPTEFGPFTLRSFTVPDDRRTPVFRVAVHHKGTDADVDGLVRDVEAIVREARHVFGEYPAFEGNTYTFIADYLPSAHGDGMEHRNSTILTSPSSIQSGASSCSTPSRTSSFMPGTSSGSGRSRSSRSTWKRPTCRASSGSPRASPAITVR